GPPAGDDAVAGNPILGHAELGRPMLDEHVELFERAFVEEQVEPLPGGQLALSVLTVDPALAAAQARVFATLLELFKDKLQLASNDVRRDARSRCPLPTAAAVDPKGVT